MADKLTLLELHMHAENNEFENEMEFSSDIGQLLRNRLGFGSSEGDETDEADEFGVDDGDDSLTSIGTADGGDAMEIEEDAEETETGSAVVEIDRDSDLVDEEDGEAEDEGGRSWGRILLVLAVLVAFAYLARSYLGGDDYEDEFEEL